MKQDDKIVSKVDSNQTATIVHAPKGKEWQILTHLGQTRFRTKSFLKKYYEVVENATNN